MKKHILLILILLNINCVFVNAYGSDIVYNNNVIQYSDQKPVILNDRTYVPIRDVFEDLNFTVEWNAQTKRVKLGNNVYIMDVDLTTNILSVFEISKGETRSFELTDKPILVSGRTMLPLREILESVNYSVEWDEVSKSVTIVSGGVNEIQ